MMIAINQILKALWPFAFSLSLPLGIPFIGVVLMLIVLAILLGPMLGMVLLIAILMIVIEQMNKIAVKDDSIKLCRTRKTVDECLTSIDLNSCVWLEDQNKCVSRVCGGKGREECNGMPKKYDCYWDNNQCINVIKQKNITETQTNMLMNGRAKTSLA